MRINNSLSAFNEHQMSSSPQVVQGDGGQLKKLLMRRLTWLVIFSYTLLILKPAMPVFMDALAHTFWEQQHLLVVHEVHGKFHVHYEMLKASHPSDKDKQASENKSGIEEYLPVAARIIYKQRVCITEKTHAQTLFLFLFILLRRF